MLKCKTWKRSIQVSYSGRASSDDFKSAATSNDTLHLHSKGHRNEYVILDYTDWSYIVFEY
jgi:hypothetical protein